MIGRQVRRAVASPFVAGARSAVATYSIVSVGSIVPIYVSGFSRYAHGRSSSDISGGLR